MAVLLPHRLAELGQTYTEIEPLPKDSRPAGRLGSQRNEAGPRTKTAAAAGTGVRGVPDARLAGDEHDLPFAAPGRVAPGAQLRQLRLASDDGLWFG